MVESRNRRAIIKRSMISTETKEYVQRLTIGTANRAIRSVQEENGCIGLVFGLVFDCLKITLSSIQRR